MVRRLDGRLAWLAVAIIVAGCNSGAASSSAPTPPTSSTPQPTVAATQQTGSFQVNVENAGTGSRPGPGTYAGPAPVDCSVTGNVWDAAFVDPKGINNVREVTIDQNSPPFVRVSTTFNNDNEGDWQVQQDAVGSKVQITVADNGKTASLTVTASDLYQTITATLVCASILRG